jgi:benzoyl-CoA reductase/2-hydroxyglutaryl-CoA dehydratase subunit BcrC/BadD/HgdB
LVAFETMQKHYRQRDLAAKEWKSKGGKVVGYFCNNVPEEMISAAGFFPVRLSGNPRGGTEKLDEYEYPAEGFTRSMANMLLTGEYNFLDYLAVPHARDSVHRLYMFLVGLKAANPALVLPELYFLDNLHTTFFSAEIFNRARWLAFKKKLEEWSGKKISPKALSKAIAINNESRMLLKQVASLRTANPPRLSGVEALQIIGSSMFMLKEEHNKLLKEYLSHADDLPERDGVRLFIEGSPLDNLQLYELVESCGATIVGEDNCWGNRYSDVLVDTTREPLEAIFDRYQRRSPCSRIYPLNRRVEYCVEAATEAKAQGAIFYVYVFDEAEAWETPDKRKALDKKNIPSLYFKQQSYLISDTSTLKTNLVEFIKTLDSKISKSS